MPQDPILAAIYDTAAAENRAGQNPRYVAWMTNSWLKAYAEITGLATVDAQTDALRRAGVAANRSAAAP